jgi:arylformamidase
MLVNFSFNGRSYQSDLRKPIDISIPLRSGEENVNAFYISPPVMEPFRAGSFVGDITQGGSCNVYDIRFNPHGNGTHTETVGHISADKYPIYKQLKEFFFVARLITVQPEALGNDLVILPKHISDLARNEWPEALIIRSLPNSAEKLNYQYSGTNPVYLSVESARLLFDNNVKHILIDLPSIDREEDGGKLAAHKAFWNFEKDIRDESTITELIYVPDEVPDGWYLLNLQTASFDNDASPSKPVIFTANTI